ncbi:MAG: LuxR C-terminal-related transcriptional regulator [Chloroflexi bacterium]|nr:LuxR C-terminal-related transcriptional regulator [Chloroflexota bacterium]
MDRLAPEKVPGFILVCAPAGYGKTTLLAEWVRSLKTTNIFISWYALDQSDNDPIPFGSYLIAGFIQALGPLPELTQIAQLQRSSPELDLQRIMQAIINAVLSSGHESVLILDDYHLIGAPPIHSAVAYLLEHLPENLRVAIGSRSEPPLPLARYRARGQLLEIRLANLRFTTEEAARFLNEVMQLELSPEAISALEERTEGWVAGLQLAALSLSGRADKEGLIDTFSGAHRYLVEYLMEEVLSRQSSETQSFLLSTAILERMCGSLCDAILGENFQSEAILAQLDRENLFLVALDDQGCWYRLHHLFRDFLLSRLNKMQPEKVNALHHLACTWLAEHAFLREAAGHAFQTGDWEYTAVFVQQHSFTMIIHSEIATIYEWCSAFPEEIMDAHPMLCILQGLALAYSFRRQNRARVEARLQQAEKGIAQLKDKPLKQEHTEMAAVVRTFLAMAPDPAADPRAQLALAREIWGHYPEGDPSRFTGLLTTGYACLALHDAQAAEDALENARQIAVGIHLYFGIVESTFHLARLAHSRGQLRRAAEICLQGQADLAAMLAHPEQELPALGCLDIALGCVLLEQDRLDEAEQHLLHGLDQMGWSMNPYYLMTAYGALFRLCELRHRSDEAAAYLSRLEEIWPDIAFYTNALKVTHALQALPNNPNTLAEASAWSRSISPSLNPDTPPPGLGPIGAAEAYYQSRLSWVRLQIAAGDLQAAKSILEPLLHLSSTNHLMERVIELSLLEALCLQADGHSRDAMSALERALQAGEPEDYINIFIQNPGIIRLLEEAAQRGTHPQYIARILAATGLPQTGDGTVVRLGSRNIQTPGTVMIEKLSERELEVLRLIAQGTTNQGIAEQLVITVGTVKSHINHILGKLEAHNRTEAVAQGRRLGLL